MRQLIMLLALASCDVAMTAPDVGAGPNPSCDLSLHFGDGVVVARVVTRCEVRPPLSWVWVWDTESLQAGARRLVTPCGVATTIEFPFDLAAAGDVHGLALLTDSNATCSGEVTP